MPTPTPTSCATSPPPPTARPRRRGPRLARRLRRRCSSQLVDLTGAPLDAWTANVDLDAPTFRNRLRAGQLLGRYDARIAAPFGSPLAAQGDPSSTLISAPFAAAARSRFVDELNYSATRDLRARVERDRRLELRARRPDAARHGARPGGGDDAQSGACASCRSPATTTWRRRSGRPSSTWRGIAEPSRLDVRAYPGGHMTYLDDGSRRRIRDDVAAWLLAPPAPAASAASTIGRLASGIDERRRHGRAGRSVRLPRAGAAPVVSEPTVEARANWRRPATPGCRRPCAWLPPDPLPKARR